jgi:hypothetical protein
MQIDGETGEIARYNNSANSFNTYMTEYRKYYNKTHMPLSITDKPIKPIDKIETSDEQDEFFVEAVVK